MVSKCTKCGNTRFELAENSPNYSRYKFFFIQCSSCGGVVGVTEYYQAWAKIDDLHKEVKSLEDKVKNMTYLLDNINGKIR